MDSADALLAGWVVADPFTGGGTSLVEGQRLGAAVYGNDVDPLAALITRHELEPLDLVAFADAIESMLAVVREHCAEHYPSGGGDEPLHYFYVRWVTCPACGVCGPLYKTPVLARDVGKAGAVVRGAEVTVFAPCCTRLHQLTRHRKTFDCCGRRWRVDAGTYAAGRYTCSGCGCTATNEVLQVGRAPRRLLAVETTRAARGQRTLRAPTAADHQAEAAARRALTQREDRLRLPRAALGAGLKVGRPGLYGFAGFDDLFTHRQRLVFGHAFAWLEAAALDDRVKQAVALAVSNALTSNNVLCGYAADYGRLSPLFGVRDFSMPTLSVELNPLHATAGRGTLVATARRVAASKPAQPTVSGTGRASVDVGDAASWRCPARTVDVVLTDPPYFDFISYSDLSLFYRVWLSASGIIEGPMQGDPLYSNAASKEFFSDRLADAFRSTAKRLSSTGLVIFTYHASTQRAWEAVVDAVRNAGLMLTAVLPIWADAKSPGHGHAGNMEWDLVLVARPASQGAGWASVNMNAWLRDVAGQTVSGADRAAWKLAEAAMNRHVEAGT